MLLISSTLIKLDLLNTLVGVCIKNLKYKITKIVSNILILFKKKIHLQTKKDKITVSKHYKYQYRTQKYQDVHFLFLVLKDKYYSRL